MFNKLVAESFTVLGVTGGQFRTAAKFADQHMLGLRAGDALHLAIASEHGATVHTLDQWLGVAGPAFGVPTQLQTRCADTYAPEPRDNSPEFRSAGLPSGGGFATARGMAAFYQMLLGQGRLVSYPRSLAAATRLSIDRLGSENPAAAELVLVCAFLGPEPIPVDMFTSAEKHLPDELAWLAS